MHPIVHLLSVAGSSSQCARCTAMSKRTKEQCGRPALKTSKTQKCQFHGGRGHSPIRLFTMCHVTGAVSPVSGSAPSVAATLEALATPQLSCWACGLGCVCQ